MKDITKQILLLLLKSDETINPIQIKAIMDILNGETAPHNRPYDPEPYLRMKELAKRLNISAVTLWRWRVPGYELGGRRRFRISEVESYLQSEEFKRRSEDLKQQRRNANMD